MNKQPERLVASVYALPAKVPNEVYQKWGRDRGQQYLMLLRGELDNAGEIRPSDLPLFFASLLPDERAGFLEVVGMYLVLSLMGEAPDDPADWNVLADLEHAAEAADLPDCRPRMRAGERGGEYGRRS